MAQSRLEKIGTIFTRVSGLLKSGALKPEDKPLWYTIYAAFPPKLEPRFDRQPVNVNIRNIFYAEDAIRAKYHHVQSEMISLGDAKYETKTQRFIEILIGLKAQGALDDEQIFNTAQEILATRQQKEVIPDHRMNNETELKSNTISEGSVINIKNLFKE